MADDNGMREAIGELRADIRNLARAFERFCDEQSADQRMQRKEKTALGARVGALERWQSAEDGGKANSAAWRTAIVGLFGAVSGAAGGIAAKWLGAHP